MNICSQLHLISLTSLEAKWLDTALALNFEGKDAILEQLSQARISREVTRESLELFFEDIPAGVEVRPSKGEILFFDAFSPYRVYVEAQLLSYNGKIDSFYIYTPDASKLELSEVPLDDVAYSVYAYRTAARHLIENLAYEQFVRCIKRNGITKDVFANRARGARADVSEMLSAIIGERLDALNGGAYDIGNLSVAGLIPLGEFEGNEYAGLVRCSLIGKFYFMYVIENGVDEAFVRSESTGLFQKKTKINYVINYPNGCRLQEVREALEKTGYKPLAGYMLEDIVEIASSKRGNIKKISILDALFTGNGICR